MTQAQLQESSFPIHPDLYTLIRKEDTDDSRMKLTFDCHGKFKVNQLSFMGYEFALNNTKHVEEGDTVVLFIPHVWRWWWVDDTDP